MVVLQNLRLQLHTRSFLALAVVTALLGGSCGGTADGPSDGGPVIVVTTSIWGDVVREIVADDAIVEVLVPIGVDPHDYSASATQVAALRTADLVVANGLGLEEGLVDVLESAAADGATVLTIADKVDPLPFGEATEHGSELDHDEDGSEVDHDEHGSELDPHVWFDPERVLEGALLVADALAAVNDSVDWRARAEAYGKDLLEIDRRIADELATVAPGSRSLVTNHDSLGYLADRYGYEVIGTVIPGGATLSSPSSADLASLVEIIENEDVPAIFAESTEPALLAEAVAGELGNAVAVVELFTGSLGEEGSGAETLLGLLITDATRIAAALS